MGRGIKAKRGTAAPSARETCADEPKRMEENMDTRRYIAMTTQARFEIGDPYCGVLDHAPTWFSAHVIATNHRGCDNVYIFDRMAWPGRSDTWENGLTTHIRPKAR